MGSLICSQCGTLQSVEATATASFCVCLISCTRPATPAGMPCRQAACSSGLPPLPLPGQAFGPTFACLRLACPDGGAVVPIMHVQHNASVLLLRTS